MITIRMRWWLALAFALVAATTAIAAAEVLSRRSEAAFRERAQALAAGIALEGSIELRDIRPAAFAATAARISEREAVSTFVLAPDGSLLTPEWSRGIEFGRMPGHEDVIAAALEPRRLVVTDPDVRATVVSVPLRRPEAASLVVYASHPELAAGFGIVRSELTWAAWGAVALGGLVGLVIASMIARRLRRIADAAAAIERGDFDVPLRSDFGDELGQLAGTIDAMRVRLRDSFRSLETERDRLELLLERLRDGVLAVDESLAVRFANGAARDLLDVEANGEPLPEPWPSHSLRAFAKRLVVAGGELAEETIEPDEDHVYVLTGVPPTRAADLAVIVIADVSERERRERAEREFVANASHELRTPLTTILGAVELLQAGAKDDAQDRDRFLAHIEREASRLVRLTRAMLVLARAQTKSEEPQVGPVELRPILEDAAVRTRAQSGVSIEVDCPEGLQALAQSELIEQAVANLSANAAEHTDEGSISLRARTLDAQRVLVEVVDTGRGMAPGARERAFDRFYRGDNRRGDGFGLGLAIVREAVRAVDGTIDIHSDARGTRVRLVLPAPAKRGT